VKPPVPLTQLEAERLSLCAEGEIGNTPAFAVRLAEQIGNKRQGLINFITDEKVAPVHVHALLAVLEHNHWRTFAVFENLELIVKNREFAVLSGKADHAYPFTPPAVKPPMILSWRNTYPMMLGIMVMITAAYMLA